MCYLLWIFYEKFLNEVFCRLWNWWKCFFWIIHVNLRYIKVSFLNISSHKWRFLCQQHVGNDTNVPEIRTQCINLLENLTNTLCTYLLCCRSNFLMYPILRITANMLHLSFMWFKHDCIYTHKERYVCVCVYLNEGIFENGFISIYPFLPTEIVRKRKHHFYTAHFGTYGNSGW